MKTIKAEDIPANASARDFLESVDLSHGEPPQEFPAYPAAVRR